MGTTSPIRDLEEIEKLKTYFLDKKEYRNFLLLSVGINTALRISDILSLKWSSVYNFRAETFNKHIILVEKKTGKNNKILLNTSCLDALKMYKEISSDITENSYIFIGRSRKKLPISRVQAFRILRHAAQEVGIQEAVSCHSLRKTFGYQARLNGADPSVLTTIYNHSCYEVTKRYLGIAQDDKDEIVAHINL